MKMNIEAGIVAMAVAVFSFFTGLIIGLIA